MAAEKNGKGTLSIVRRILLLTASDPREPDVWLALRAMAGNRRVNLERRLVLVPEATWRCK